MDSDACVRSDDVLFDNPFHIEDIQIFDDEAWENILTHSGYGLTIEVLACALHAAPAVLLKHIKKNIQPQQYQTFIQEQSCKVSPARIAQAQRKVLNALFWELIYWKTPELYEELTEGERLHPGIFQRLGPDICGKTVLDAGAGSGRAVFECLQARAKCIYAVEPSPGLQRIMRQKLQARDEEKRVIVRPGRFEALPLADNSVDCAFSCSAFTADAEQGGEPGLAEMKRVTRPGGKIVIIWPRAEDHAWLHEHGFQYVVLPVVEEMRITFRSLESARHCVQLFYAHNPAAMQYIEQAQRPELPFSVIGLNPPRDYYWLDVVDCRKSILIP